VQLLGATIIPRKVTEFFRSIIHETVSTREKEGVVRPDMIQLLMQAKKRTLKDEASSENTKDTDKDYGMYDNN
jgi:cytochrome P450 family 9